MTFPSGGRGPDVNPVEVERRDGWLRAPVSNTPFSSWKVEIYGRDGGRVIDCFSDIRHLHGYL
jgi:hypothetical protein